MKRVFIFVATATWFFLPQTHNAFAKANDEAGYKASQAATKTCRLVKKTKSKHLIINYEVDSKLINQLVQSVIIFAGCWDKNEKYEVEFSEITTFRRPFPEKLSLVFEVKTYGLNELEGCYVQILCSNCMNVPHLNIPGLNDVFYTHGKISCSYNYTGKLPEKSLIVQDEYSFKITF